MERISCLTANSRTFCPRNVNSMFLPLTTWSKWTTLASEWPTPTKTRPGLLFFQCVVKFSLHLPLCLNKKSELNGWKWAPMRLVAFRGRCLSGMHTWMNSSWASTNRGNTMNSLWHFLVWNPISFKSSMSEKNTKNSRRWLSSIDPPKGFWRMKYQRTFKISWTNKIPLIFVKNLKKFWKKMSERMKFWLHKMKKS